MIGSRQAEVVAVLGAGAMGAGIADTFAASGHQVRIFDSRMELATSVAACHSTTHLTAVASVEAAVRGATIVIEAVTEDLQVKIQLLREVQTTNKSAIVASNTSTFLPGRLAEGLDYPSQLIVAHFFNPPRVVPLVEVVPSASSDPSAVRRMMNVLREMGKKPVLLQRETEGFIANRLQAAMVREALSLWRAGVADPETIDAVVTDGLGARWAVAGPFRIMDFGGLDVWNALIAELFPKLTNETATPEIGELVDSGHLGAKSGRGFYAHGTAAASEFAEQVREVTELTSDIRSQYW